ncbi:MAG: DNA polymerase IV [Patescibacteria group bacterium]
MKRIILHIDMNSYFASVASQANPFLRGTTFGVGGKPGTRGIIAAASREAKKRGVKTAMNAYEALRICPELEIIHGDPRMYSEITNRFLRIFRRHTEEVEVFSIDEAFLDLTGWVGRQTSPSPSSQEGAAQVFPPSCEEGDGGSAMIVDAIRLAREIKAEMHEELGDQLTCSIGIAENKLLAKLGSDMKKPDGIVVLTPAVVAKLWPTLPVTDLCGIGNRIGPRLLDRFGVSTAADLGAVPVDKLIDEFGPVMGYHLHLMGRGEDSSPVISTIAAAKSYGHSYTLPRDLHPSTGSRQADRNELRKVLFTLAEKVCRRMREDDACGRLVSVYVRYGDFTGDGGRTTLTSPINDGLALFREGWRIVKPLIAMKSVRLLGISIGDIRPAEQQSSLFEKDNKRRQVVVAADAANDKWGECTVEPTTIAGTVLKRHVSGFHHALPVHVRRNGRSADERGFH